jgi:hypothetical protein
VRLFAILLGACAVDPGPLVVTPSTVALEAATWSLEVGAAAAEWTAAGCPVELADGGIDVVAWSAADWPLELWIVGRYRDIAVDVRADLGGDQRRLVLLHELGHALGIGAHTDRGIMHRYGLGADFVTAEDAELCQ